MASPPKTSTITKLRPGRRGKGSKPARARSIAEFSNDYSTVSSDRGYVRARRRNARDERRAKDKESGELDRIRRELMAAFDAVSAQTATAEQRKLIRDAQDAEFFGKRYSGQQEAWDRMFGTGFVHPGGFIAGKYFRKKFAERGLRTWRHPFFKRVAASTARAWTGRLRTGPEKSKCIRQYSKLHALDELYFFFCDECRDMFRIDCDETFDSEAELRLWIEHKVRELGLPSAPHLAVFVPDDRFPGKIIRPHIYVLLPEGHAVWKESPPDQHRLLNQVIIGLTKSFQGDEGGLANPFHGKNPLSPLTEVIILQDTHLPTLGEWAEALDVEYDPALIARRMATERMEKAGFDRGDSNTWFSSVRDLANDAGKTLFKSGFNIADQVAFAAKTADVITPLVIDLIKPDAPQLKTVLRLIQTCCRFMAAGFDPSRMDTTGRDRGAADHLMEEGDTAEVRMRKGQSHSAAVKVRRTRALITKFMLPIIRAGEEPTIAGIAKASGRAYNTVKAHFFQCYVTAVASIAVQDLVKGVHPPSCQHRPSSKVLLTANKSSDIPASWDPRSGGTLLAENFNRKAANLAHLRRRRPGAMSVVESIRAPGYNAMSFISSGPVTVYRITSRHRVA